MAVPLLVRGEVIGTISVATTDPEQLYDASDRERARCSRSISR
jgi:GAF domain-containing protein